MNKILDSMQDDIKQDIPEFKSGDTVSVGVKVIEGEKSRIQIFKGLVIAISAGSGMGKTFTVRKVSNGVGVERIFPLHSPNLDSIDVVKKGKVRRAKLYYLRNRQGKAAKVKEIIN
jgi:large subunit ribosomal protein L19